MSENKEIKIESVCEDSEQIGSVECIVNNIKKEPEVEFVLILPPRQVKIEKFENDEFRDTEAKRCEKKFQCQQCPKSFDKQRNLFQHEQTHKPKFKCEICNKKVRLLRAHLKSHESIKEFNCDHCPAGFVTKNHLDRHMWTHRRDKLFNCTHCKQGFNNVSNFKAHILSHSTNPKPFQCDLCPKNYARKQQVKEHLMAIHSEQIFKCNECDCTTKTKSALNHHKSMHSNLKSFSCRTCEKKFKTKTEVRQHQSVHRTTKNFECKTCGKMFKTEKETRQHQVVHGENFEVFHFNHDFNCYFLSILVAGKNFACSKCPKTFKSKDNLKQHERSHLNDGTVNCPKCSKQFIKRNLKNHLNKSECGKK
jgi:KRAB domain-containing zinc finger protein